MSASPLDATIRDALAEGSPARFRTALAAVIRHFRADMGMIHRLNPADQHLELVATSDGEPVACGGVQGLPDGAAEIKRMWVDGRWRGAGLGARLLRHLEELSRERGYAVVRLDTNDTLVEAIAMYQRAGYRTIGRYNDNPWARCWFEKDL